MPINLPPQHTRVVISTLQSETHWLTYEIPNMGSAHIQNCLRMLYRFPLATLHGVARANDRDAWESAGSDFGWDPCPTPVKVEKILQQHAELVALRQRITSGVLNSDEIDEITDELHQLPNLAALEEQAIKWIRMQPTARALKRELWARIVDGRALIYRSTADTAPVLEPTQEW